MKKCMLPLLVAFPATVLAWAPADPFKYPDEYTNPYNQSERNKATPFEMALFYNNSTDQFSMAFRDLRSDRLIRFSSGDTPNNVEISGCKKEMKGSLEYGTGLPKLMLKTTGNRELKTIFLDCADVFFRVSDGSSQQTYKPVAGSISRMQWRDLVKDGTIFVN
ncbi:Uncharacterised protein [Serratia liquefaciens]|uniref:hypothetical protein n=1 Tax=Serratia liquefaciens TaxID=614 RepID=UPI0021828BE4|nr:hypothetical protein [Serratia liquefaciens]CAI2477841.1 Uncharacterised protein [Serratia liquefaciens]